MRQKYRFMVIGVTILCYITENNDTMKEKRVLSNQIRQYPSARMSASKSATNEAK
ncbi:hypothetical protein EVA_22277 [gut metagenome]|uniref:Uncharacterized protein n=1 Tax=gut metagenome TaxID=749906 RepID=J9FQI9_9ZZZZ